MNLDINTYTIDELENLFKLKPPYTKENVYNKKKELETNIIKSNINQIKKDELLIFLDNIDNKLTNNLLKIDESKYNDVKQYDGNHFIIKNENKKYTTTLENNKKINKSIIKRTYTIDSQFRQNYDDPTNKSHDYIIQLPETINKAITMSISSVEIPITYHNISEILNNNIFNITIQDSTNNIIGTDNIILSDGLYESRFSSANQLTAGNITFTAQVKAFNIEREIKNQISKVKIKDTTGITDISATQDISNALKFEIDKRNGYGYFEYKDTLATKIKLSNNYKIKIDFDINNDEVRKHCSDNFIYQKLGWQLGFRKKNFILDASNDVFTDTNNEFAREFSAGICYPCYPRYIYIAIDDFQASSRNFFSIASDSIIAPNIIGRINILSLLEEKTAFKQAAAPGDFLYNQKHIREYFGPTDINKLKISLLDEYGRPFTLNNMEWSFVLSMECFYN